MARTSFDLSTNALFCSQSLHCHASFGQATVHLCPLCCKIFFSPLAISAACPPAGGAILPAFLAIAASVTAVLAQSQVLSFPVTLQVMDPGSLTRTISSLVADNLPYDVGCSATYTSSSGQTQLCYYVTVVSA
ncbi:hypothetical protein SCLCIDRAFT_861213 [Scleroderma citrinum Foug A]|uniref:Uncharacterized protein n=1 Tax=Scleroderma citrinum Foug A TaxID=1036808 RepID=A0A0C3AAF0_9AGAM|nr:hypothetical protein SCLCIDRAFT_861213 [Scleroderma citrinum Foug A]